LTNFENSLDRAQKSAKTDLGRSATSVQQSRSVSLRPWIDDALAGNTGWCPTALTMLLFTALLDSHVTWPELAVWSDGILLPVRYSRFYCLLLLEPLSYFSYCRYSPTALHATTASSALALNWISDTSPFTFPIFIYKCLRIQALAFWLPIPRNTSVRWEPKRRRLLRRRGSAWHCPSWLGTMISWRTRWSITYV